MPTKWRYQCWTATRNCREMTIHLLISIGIILHFLFHLHNLLDRMIMHGKYINFKHCGLIKLSRLGLMPLRQAALTCPQHRTSLFATQWPCLQPKGLDSMMIYGSYIDSTYSLLMPKLSRSNTWLVPLDEAGVSASLFLHVRENASFEVIQWTKDIILQAINNSAAKLPTVMNRGPALRSLRGIHVQMASKKTPISNKQPHHQHRLHHEHYGISHLNGS